MNREPNLDIRKLQRAIVDGLEDVKAQDIAVFNTEHLSALFERVIVATGSSNRQTKALASSVRESVKSRGLQVMATEGEDNGEWIIVDCGAAVVHIMQPGIREYYHLEEIWGGKPVRLKTGTVRTGLVKASEPMDAPPAKAAARTGTKAGAKAGAKTTGQAGTATRATVAAKAPPRTVAKKAAKVPARAGTKTAAKTAAKTPAKTSGKTPAQAVARPAAAADVPPSHARRRSTPAVQTVVVKPAGKATGKAPAKSAARAPAKTAPRAAAKGRSSRG